MITSDKCYLNIEKKAGYKESDNLGGKDPYSASKASAEMLIYSYKQTFFKQNKNLKFCSVRAGNVIGGGDWSSNRLVPDCIRAWSKNKKIKIRNMNSTRPWQHVIDAVGAYIYLGYILNKSKKLNGSPFNFGPTSSKNYKTKDFINLLSKNFKKKIKIGFSKKTFKESGLLKLNCNKAQTQLGWSSVFSFNETISLTALWYEKYYYHPKEIINLTKNQIQNYMNKFKKKIRKKIK